MLDKLFLLLRLGLGNSSVAEEDISIIEHLTDVEWTNLISTAEEQGVGAIVFDAFEKLKGEGENDCLPEKNQLMQLFGYTLQLERSNARQVEIMKDMCGKWHRDGCQVMVMKGQANGLLYPNPSRRATGDVDVYLFDTYDLGNKLSLQYGAKVDTSWYKHSQIFYRGEMFENHLFFVTTREGGNSKKLNEEMCRFLSDAKYEKYPNTEIILPPVMFNALFLTYHSFSHFLAEGIHLRQILDWAVFVKKNQQDIDWRELNVICEKYHLKKFLDITNEIATKHLGVHLSDKEIVTDCLYTPKVIDSIFNDKDFIFGGGKGKWHNRFHLVKNLFKYRWKYRDIYQQSICKQIYLYLLGFFFKTES